MKLSTLALILCAFALTLPADAGNRNNRNNSRMNKQAKKWAQEQKREREARKAGREVEQKAIESYLRTKDLNGDGSVSFDEFKTGESDESSARNAFDEANRNGDRYLTKTEISKMIGADKKRDEFEKSRLKKNKK